MRYPAHVAVGSSPDVLRRILEPDINLVIWERVPDRTLIESVKSVAAAVPMVIRTLPVVGDRALPVSAALESFRRELPLGLRTPAALPLAGDIRQSAKLFTRIVRPEHLTLSWRTERVARQAYDFHADTLRYRLICCYYGKTTRWLANGDAIAVPGNMPEYRKRFLARMHSLPLFAICIFKGIHEMHTCLPFVHTEPQGSALRLLSVIND